LQQIFFHSRVGSIQLLLQRHFYFFSKIFLHSIDLPHKYSKLPRMKEISLHQAYDLLQLSTAIVLEGRLIEPTLMGVQDDDSNEFMYVSWEEEFDDEDLIVELSFFEGDNQIALIDGTKLTLIADQGEEEEFLLLREFDAESTIIPKN
jgi:hypothetical protein